MTRREFLGLGLVGIGLANLTARLGASTLAAPVPACTDSGAWVLHVVHDGMTFHPGGRIRIAMHGSLTVRPEYGTIIGHRQLTAPANFMPAGYCVLSAQWEEPDSQHQDFAFVFEKLG